MKKISFRLKGLFSFCVLLLFCTGCASLPVLMPEHYERNVNYKNLTLSCEIGPVQWGNAPNESVRRFARKYMEAKLIEDKRFKVEIMHNRDFDNLIKQLQEVGERTNTATLKDKPIHLALSISPEITMISGADRGKSVVLYKADLTCVYYSMTNDKVEKQAAAKITGTSKDVYVTTRGGRMIGMLSHADVSKAVQAALDDAMNKVSLMLLRKVPIVAKVSKVFFDGDDCILRLDTGSRMGIRNNKTPMILLDDMGIPLAFGLPISVESDESTIRLRQWNKDSKYASSVRSRLSLNPDSMNGKLIMISNIDQPVE